MGVLLYDADRIETVAQSSQNSLAEAQRSIILDPFDPKVISDAKASGLSPEIIEAAQISPVYKYVVRWQLALPLHAEFRTVPMLYYVPPLLPILGRMEGGTYSHDNLNPFTPIDKARIPIRYLAKLFAAGNDQLVEDTLKRLLAVRIYKRAESGDSTARGTVERVLHDAGLTVELAEEIYAMTALASDQERFNIPPLQREESIEGGGCSAESTKGLVGLGRRTHPKRGP
jgi:nitrate reductase beta subunit